MSTTYSYTWLEKVEEEKIGNGYGLFRLTGWGH